MWSSNVVKCGMLSPFELQPVLAPKPWGGTTLAKLGKVVPPGVTVGESWEVADLPYGEVSTVEDGRTFVARGEFAGWDLRRLIATFGPDLLGTAQATPDGRFPLLVKLLDAAENLSVQVHPPEAFVARHPGARLKTESWYVVRADSGAVVYLGANPGWSRQEVVDSFGTPDVVGRLRQIRAEMGSFFHLPAGALHALGAGVTAIEVQTPSDTTYRVYDWSGEHKRRPRELHVEQAAESYLADPEGMLILGPQASAGSRTLTRNPHYVMVEHRGVGVAWNDAELRIVMVVDGSLEVDQREYGPGATVLVPAAAAPSTSLEPSPGGVWLEIGLTQAVADTALPNASSAVSTSS